MAVPVFTVGQVLGAADVNTWLQPVFTVVKPGTTTRNTLTLSIDPDLQGTLPYANAAYEVRCGMQYNCASGGFGWTWTVPAGSAGSEQFFGTIGANASGASAWTTTNSATSSTTGALLIQGTVTTGATTGTIGIQWASSTGPVSLAVAINSYLIVNRIA